MKRLTYFFSHGLLSLSFLLVGLLMSTAMTAQDYCLDVGGIDVTSANCDNITGPTISGKVWFDPATRTLTLQNATINVKNDDGIGMESIYWSLVGDDLTIVLEGTNIINVIQDDNYVYHAISLTQTATITGPGVLLTNYDIRTYGTDLEINGDCKVTAKAISNDTYYNDGRTLILSGSVTEIHAHVYGFDNLVLKDDLKILVPYHGYYDSTNRYLAGMNGQYPSAVYIAQNDYTVSNTKLWVKGKMVGENIFEEGWPENYNIPVDKGTATFNAYSKTLTLNEAEIRVTEDGKYGITNFDPAESYPDLGDLLNIVVNGTCKIWCTDVAMMLNGGLVTISGDGKLVLMSDDQSALKMFDRSIVNIDNTNVNFETQGGPAIKGEWWMRTEIVNVIHSSLLAYSPTYTTDQISGFNLLKCRFQDDGGLKGELFGFDETQGGSITYDGGAHRGRAIIKPYELYRYLIYLGGTEVTSDNQDDPLGDGAFSYDPMTSTLTMKKSTDRSLSAYRKGGLTLRVENNVSLTHENGIRTYAGCPLTITGPGRLSVTKGLIVTSDKMTFIDADVEAASRVLGNGDNAKLDVKFSRLKAKEISRFTGGITLAGCYISSPAGAQVKDGAIVDAAGDVITTGVTILPREVKKGDVNGDGAIDVADISEVISVMAGSVFNPHADVNGDGAIDVADISEVITIMASK